MKSEKLKITEASYNKLSRELSNNYEVFIGKEFMNSDKLNQLETIMKNNGLSTIKQAIDFFKDNK
jgi:hypothetical protein